MSLMRSSGRGCYCVSPSSVSCSLWDVEMKENCVLHHHHHHHLSFSFCLLSLSVCLCVSLSLSLSVCLFFSPSLSVSVSLSLSVCLSLRPAPLRRVSPCLPLNLAALFLHLAWPASGHPCSSTARDSTLACPLESLHPNCVSHSHQTHTRRN